MAASDRSPPDRLMVAAKAVMVSAANQRTIEAWLSIIPLGGISTFPTSSPSAVASTHGQDIPDGHMFI